MKDMNQIREKTGMTRKGLAEYLNIPYRTLQNWEYGISAMPEYLAELIEYKLVKEGKITEPTMELTESRISGCVGCILSSHGFNPDKQSIKYRRIVEECLSRVESDNLEDATDKELQNFVETVIIQLV
jgi:transcriptional regulator with XRE-family HTH domain